MYNTGDDALCVVGAWGARRYWGITQIAVNAGSALTTPGCPKAVLPRRQAFRGHWLLHSLANRLAARRLLYCGGSLFQDRPAGLRYLSALVEASRSIPRGAIGVSIGPFPDRSSEDWFRSYLGNLQFITVRDGRSEDLARRLGLGKRTVRAFDLAVLLPLVAGPGVRLTSRGSARPMLGLNVCHYERYRGGDSRVERLRELGVVSAVREVGRVHGLGVRVFALNGHPRLGDAQLAREVAEELDSSGLDAEVVPYSPDPVSALEAVADCQAFVSFRLHGAVLAYTAGVPFVLTEYHQKCTDFLDEIDYPAEFRMPSPLDQDLRAAEAIESLVCGHSGQPSELLPVSDAQARALRSFTEVDWREWLLG